MKTFILLCAIGKWCYWILWFFGWILWLSSEVQYSVVQFNYKRYWEKEAEQLDALEGLEWDETK